MTASTCSYCGNQGSIHILAFGMINLVNLKQTEIFGLLDFYKVNNSKFGMCRLEPENRQLTAAMLQVVKSTFTCRPANMLGTHRKEASRFRLASWF